ncbi:MAG: hypothetical protein HKM89_11605 [Gemmatimonadales bacterium]|nr:hypothetical protein [Gemmatimonadales bacterium]
MRREGVVAVTGWIALAGFAVPLAAQARFYPTTAVTTGVEARRYSFGAGFGAASIRQVAAPLAIVVPVGRRFAIDVGTAIAATRVTRSDGSFAELNQITDTQVRASYIFGRDVAVVTVMVNLPTGDEEISVAEFAVTSAIASPFLSFPVSTYSSGTSVTGGVAVAQPLGPWNVGLAGSLRLNSKYEPFVDAPEPFTYREGLEGRVRFAAERLVGSTSLAMGLTYSTHGQDEFQRGSISLGGYQSGDRLVAEFGMSGPVGGGTLTGYIWNYHRFAARDSVDLGVANRENVVAAGLSGSFPLGRSVELQPGLEGRIWSPDRGTGRLLGLSTALAIRPADRFAVVPEGRIDAGSFETQAGRSITVTGWGFSLFIRYSL